MQYCVENYMQIKETGYNVNAIRIQGNIKVICRLLVEHCFHSDYNHRYWD